MKLLKQIGCAALAVFLATAFCACKKDEKPVNTENPTDYGTMKVAHVRLYENYPEAEIYIEFSLPQYAQDPKFTFDSDLFEIDGTRAILKKTPTSEKRVTVFAETPNHNAFFEVICSDAEFEPDFDFAATRSALSLQNYADKEVVFAGDSFFSESYWTSFGVRFSSLGAYAVGIGSTTAFQWEIFARRIFYPVQPDIIAMHVGTNDLAGGASPEETAEALISLFNNMLLNLPQTTVYWFIVEMREGVDTAKIEELNGKISAFAANTPRLFVLDSFSRFEKEGEMDDSMYADGVHPSEKGYEVFPALLKEAGVTIPAKAQS